MQDTGPCCERAHVVFILVPLCILLRSPLQAHSHSCMEDGAPFSTLNNAYLLQLKRTKCGHFLVRHLFWVYLSPLGSMPPPDISDFLSFSVAHDQLQAPPCKIGTTQDQRPSQIGRMPACKINCSEIVDTLSIFSFLFFKDLSTPICCRSSFAA